MDDFKRKTMVDYTVADLNCPQVVKRTKYGRQLMKIYKRKARKNLKNDIRKEMNSNGI